MKKSEFLDKLCQGLRFQTDPDEIRKVVAYYDQAIEDRIEDGMSEQEAVAAMGDIYHIIREARSAWEQDGAASQAGSEDGGNGRVSLAYDPAYVRRIDISDTFGDVTVGPSPDGSIHIEYTASDAWRYEIAGDSVLTVRRVRAPSNGERFNFDIFGCKFSFSKPDFSGLFSGSPELEIRLPASPVELRAATGSGDVDIHAVALASLDLKLADGDVSLEAVTVEGKASVATANGDVELTEVSAGEIAVNTASGDVDAGLLRANGFSLHAASGDLCVENGEIRERLSAVTVSGDVDVQLDFPCPDVRVETVSGDVGLELPGGDSLYTVLARAKSGDVDVDGEALGGPNHVTVKTVSGDIDVSFGG